MSCLGKCTHNTSPKALEDILAKQKAEQAAQEREWTKHLEPFDMKEWYRRTGRSND
jgi:hypothetical protein